MKRRTRGPIYLSPQRNEGKRRYILSAAVLAAGVLLFASSQHAIDAQRRNPSSGFASLQQHIVSNINNRSSHLRSVLEARKGEAVIIRVFVNVDKSGHASIQGISAQCGQNQCSNYGSIESIVQLDLSRFRLTPPEKPYTFSATTSLSTL